MCRRTTLPPAKVRSWTRSQSWLHSHRPWPPAWPLGGPLAPGERIGDAPGVARPRRSARRRPARCAACRAPPPWRIELVATSLTASTRSLGALAGEPGAARAPRHEPAHARPACPRRRAARSASAGGSGSGSANGAGDRVEAVVGRRSRAARRRRPRAGWLWCAFAMTSGSSAVDVVRAQQPEVRGAREGEVEQRLVALALDELVGAALGPDRLADAPQPAPSPGVGVDELAPRRDDARGVDADLGHVGERARARRRRRARRAGARSSRRRPRRGSARRAATASRSNGSVAVDEPSSPA